MLGPECGSGDAERPVDATALRVLRAFQQQPYEEAARIRLDGILAQQLESLMYTLTQAASERELKSAQFVAAARRAEATSDTEDSAEADEAEAEGR